MGSHVDHCWLPCGHVAVVRESAGSILAVPDVGDSVRCPDVGVKVGKGPDKGL